MINETKCPFCGEILRKSDDCYVCLNDECIFFNTYLFVEKWLAVIKLKEALMYYKEEAERLENELNYALNGESM